MSFAFLTRSLRQILPRKEIRERDRRSGAYPVKSKTGDRTRSGRNKVYFDDAHTVMFLTGTNITYPTTLQFDSSKVSFDLTSSLGAVGNVDPYAVDQWIPHFDQSEKCGPFSESDLFEQDETNLVNSNFMTGVAYGIASDKFKSKISNKTIVRAEFPLTRTSQMSTGSQVMYFNQRSGCFEHVIKENSFVTNGNTNGITTLAPLPFTPYGMHYMPLNDYALSGYSFGYGLLPLTPDNAIKRMVTYLGDGSDSPFFDVTGFTVGQVTASVLNPSHRASPQQTLTLDGLGHPFLLEKVVVEFPFQAGPGWLNDSFRMQESQQGSDLNLTADAGGPMITFALMRQDGADAQNRDIIASGTITTLMDITTGSYNVCTGFYGGGGTFTSIMATPNGVAHLGIVPSVAISGPFLSASNNFFTGTVRLVMDPQITTHMLRQSFSGGSYFFYTEEGAVVFGPITRRSAKYLESGRNVLGNEFALLDPAKVDFATNPVLPMDSQYESEFATQPARTSFTTMSMNVKSNTRKSPYLLYPEDKLVLCLSKHRACGDNSIIDFANGAGPRDPTSMWAYHDVAIGNGSLKITLYGDLIREDTEFHDTLNQRLETAELWQDVGEDPVLDQFDVAYRNELSGCYLDRFSVRGAMPYTSDVLTSSLEVTRLYSNFSSAVQDMPISNFAAWTKGKRVFELAKSSRNGQHFSTNEAFWDTRLVNPAQAMRKANPSFAVCLVDAVFGSQCCVIYSGIAQTLSFGISSTGAGVSEWFMSYPFEPRFQDITTAFKLGKDIMPANFGRKTTFSYNDLAFELGDTINRALMVGEFGSDSNLVTNINPLPKNEFIKYFYGIGGGYGKRDNQHVRGRLMGTAGTSGQFASSSARIRGWKYGMMNGFTQYSKQVYRRDHYGQPRDLLEQRLDAKFFDELGLSPDGNQNGSPGVRDAPIRVSFYDSTGKPTDALKTLSSNISFEATSSRPYTDGTARNRPEYDFGILNIVNVTI